MSTTSVIDKVLLILCIVGFLGSLVTLALNEAELRRLALLPPSRHIEDRMLERKGHRKPLALATFGCAFCAVWLVLLAP